MHKIKKEEIYSSFFSLCYNEFEDTYMNKQDHDELLKQGLTQKEIGSYTKRFYQKRNDASPSI